MVALVLANLKMMARNRQAIFWALFFPLMLVVVFGLFDFNGVGAADVAVIDQSGGPRAELFRERLEGIEFLELEFEEIDPSQARDKVADGDLGYLIIIPEMFDLPAAQAQAVAPAPVTLVYSTRNPDRNQLVDGAVRNLVSEIQSESGPVVPSQLLTADVIQVPEVDYFDTVLLGLLGLGIMTNSIISIAVRISTFRNQSILKRLLVTPLPIWKFFAAEITAHVLLALVQAAIILSLGVFVFGGHVNGNILWVFAITALGSVVFLNIGFILSAWAKSPAAASGMGNAVALPMMFLGGTFFSTAALPWILPQLSLALPLTPMLAALREVAIDSAPIWDTWPYLAAMGGWVVATALAAIKVFKFG
ncbi:MAG: ABC transporter permease [Chloroflexi bacterium]|nr:ABC transporter permease [Chloroflexota bacterium]